MPTLFGLSAAILSLFYAFAGAGAFTFTFGTPSECDNLPLTWTGGTPPFQFLIIPVFGTPTNISIPSSAFNNGVGNYSFQLPLAHSSQMVFTMSDATGFNAGGSTDLLTVQPSKGGLCDTSGAQVAFSFQLNSALQQCRPFLFSGYDGAVQPVTIGAVIPGGNAFNLNPPVGPSFDWTANVAHGTSIIFFMTDAQGRQGGSSDILIVGTSDDSTCLDGNSPSSTSGAPSASATAPSSPTSSTPPSSSSPANSGISIAAVAGTVIGALLFLAVIITLGLFFLRRKRDERSGGNARRQSRRLGSGFDPSYDPSLGPLAPQYALPPPTNGLLASPYPYSPSTVPNTPNPFLDASPSQYDTSSQYLSDSYQPSESMYQNSGYRPHSQLYPPQQTYPPSNYSSSDPFHPAGPPMLPGTEFEPFSMGGGPEPSTSRDSMSTTQRKAAMASSASRYKPPRFIVHTDVEDILPPPNEDGVVELPPQYTERHGPLGSMNPLPPSADAGYHQPGSPYPR